MAGRSGEQLFVQDISTTQTQPSSEAHRDACCSLPSCVQVFDPRHFLLHRLQGAQDLAEIEIERLVARGRCGWDRSEDGIFTSAVGIEDGFGPPEPKMRRAVDSISACDGKVSGSSVVWPEANGTSTEALLFIGGSLGAAGVAVTNSAKSSSKPNAVDDPFSCRAAADEACEGYPFQAESASPSSHASNASRSRSCKPASSDSKRDCLAPKMSRLDTLAGKADDSSSEVSSSSSSS